MRQKDTGMQMQRAGSAVDADVLLALLTTR
jgi:hypothetical protein